ncbi:HAMP domain-containing histidine kinase [Idiomarina sp. M1R2S28]|uniref:histidine kinase n=1 Tax=Idiomarina rhizosphaerae TaxID=2961572 RepID=A0A9X2FSJ9_9GAMM|nr:HAMP domain-containing sensor histidine kinase [Idiomarina rhizosphaerae]MCP1338321.1 HAMP domain-containing histidine kinase [Idiomarina rhizosphaerae]
MFGQMAILTAFVTCVGTYYLVIQPTLENTQFVESSPIQATLNRTIVEFNQYIFQRREGSDLPFRESDYLHKVRQANPDFRYYLRFENDVFDSGAGSLFYERFGFRQFNLLNKQFSTSTLCSSAIDTFQHNGSNAYYKYYSCNGSFDYYEFSGLNTAIETSTTSMVMFYLSRIWASSQYLIFSAGAVFLVFVLMMVGNLVMIRRVARLARSFDPESLDQQLPEEGLPNEVVPLVQAVNQMIGKVDETHRRHKFFLSTAAHEMRTPLTVLRNRLEMMEESELKEKLIGDVRRLVNLVNQLLTLMRGGPKAIDTEIDIVKCIQRVCSERQLIADDKNVALRLQTEVPYFAMLADRGLMEVAIANLIDNALSFSPAGSEVLITLSADGKLSVRDHGPGIPAQHLTALFEPFAKFPPNRNGHGLGLAIVEAAVTLHGAKIEACNATPNGAIFTIHLNPSQAPLPNNEKSPQ